MKPRRVVLIGGGAGTGKTTVARVVSRSLGAGWLQVDTIWLALMDAAEPASVRRRVLDVDHALRHGTTPAEDLLGQHMDAAAIVCRALPRALAFELQTHRTVVADGAWILPDWAAQLELEGIDVRPIFLHEPDAAHLRAAMASRRSMPMAAPWHDRSTRLAWLFGDTVAREASRLGLPVVVSRPYASLVERVVAAVG